jgi:transcriptional regulator with XRE-family HTH domain
MPRSRVYNADAVRFGAILRRLREQRGWTKQKLAKRAGLTPSYIGIVEEGGNAPTIATFLELLEVLGADAADVTRQLALARNAPPVKAAPLAPELPGVDADAPATASALARGAAEDR